MPKRPRNRRTARVFDVQHGGDDKQIFKCKTCTTLQAPGMFCAQCGSAGTLESVSDALPF